MYSAKGLAAAHVTGDTTDDEVKVRVRRGEFKLVYITPELLLCNCGWRKMLIGVLHRTSSGFRR